MEEEKLEFRWMWCELEDDFLPGALAAAAAPGRVSLNGAIAAAAATLSTRLNRSRGFGKNERQPAPSFFNSTRQSIIARGTTGDEKS